MTNIFRERNVFHCEGWRFKSCLQTSSVCANIECVSTSVQLLSQFIQFHFVLPWVDSSKYKESIYLLRVGYKSHVLLQKQSHHIHVFMAIRLRIYINFRILFRYQTLANLHIVQRSARWSLFFFSSSSFCQSHFRWYTFMPWLFSVCDLKLILAMVMFL